jgi:hypothetical protein
MNKSCNCGLRRDDPLVSAKTKYNRWGWLLLSIGISAKPIEIIFECQKCGGIVETSKDPVLLVRYRYNSDIIK